jgi:hypothetical protein
MNPIITNNAEFSLLEPGIICVKLIDDMEVKAEEAKIILDITNKLSEGKFHCILYDFNGKNVIISDFAKKLASFRSITSDHLLARAFLVYNLNNKLEVNNLIRQYKPQVPTQAFETREEALKYLRTAL